jgi:pimeloyl-ACP methyl ester carboxylesterase
MTITLYPLLLLPVGITERYIETDDLTFHVLEAGYDPSKKKLLVLLLHGFPELAFSWRKAMLAIATDEYHVVAYDQRSYGRTTG